MRPAFLVGRGNRIEAPGLAGATLRFTTEFHSECRDNIITVGPGFRTSGLRIAVKGTGNRIEIGVGVTWSGRISVTGDHIAVRIGDRSDGKGVSIVAWEQPVTIGADCLFARRIELRSSDVHPISDRRTGERLNSPAPVEIGDRVWVALDAVLLKGARIPDGCVVGARSLVTRSFDEPNCVIAGIPARVVRRDISWQR